MGGPIVMPSKPFFAITNFATDTLQLLQAVQFLTMTTTQEGENKAMGAILLRRLVGRVGVWPKIPQSGQRAVLQKLFHAFENEKVSSIQHKVAHVIAQLVAVQKENQDGLVNHALKAISGCAKTGETSRFEAALFLLDKMLEHADAVSHWVSLVKAVHQTSYAPSS